MAESTGCKAVECERKSGRRRKKGAPCDIKKESFETQTYEASEISEEPPLPECAICLQTCVYPARLPCSHIFCFLCLKGIASQSRRCAMCRQDIPQDYLEHPDLIHVPLLNDKLDNDNDNDKTEDGYQWFYEGRNGWWQYDERTSHELESSYKQGSRNCELLIAGFLYIADFDSMLQIRRNEPSRYRRIKRDLASIPKKGIAGIRLLANDTIIEQMNNLSISSSSSPDSQTNTSVSNDDSIIITDNSLHTTSRMSASAVVNNDD
ncbi:E3 ubiquitin-protein ligase rnf146-like isoform X1 [Lycorma delicatula]|uniref:E3 ubiquitin-protein ligase rnf146-like isoform X1 n=1 Tax=Lycorma delicatula TaxID=130591 RepID=UPI003F514E19